MMMETSMMMRPSPSAFHWKRQNVQSNKKQIAAANPIPMQDDVSPYIKHITGLTSHSTEPTRKKGEAISAQEASNFPMLSVTPFKNQRAEKDYGRRAILFF
jgi:hypothetical protein